jgi:hypothetical protein
VTSQDPDRGAPPAKNKTMLPGSGRFTAASAPVMAMALPAYHRHLIARVRVPAAPAVRLPLDVQQQLRQALVQWMQALAKMIREEDDHE